MVARSARTGPPRILSRVGQVLDHNGFERSGPIGTLSVRTSRPTARPAHAIPELVEANRDAALPGLCLLCGGDPADPFISGERRDVVPSRCCGPICRECFLQVRGHRMQRPSGGSCGAKVRDALVAGHPAHVRPPDSGGPASTSPGAEHAGSSEPVKAEQRVPSVQADRPRRGMHSATMPASAGCRECFLLIGDNSPFPRDADREST